MTLRYLQMTEARFFIAWLERVTEAPLRDHRHATQYRELRRVATVALREEGLSLAEIGRILGRDHTSILQRIRKATAEEAAYARAYRDLFREHQETGRLGDAEVVARRLMATQQQLLGELA